MRSGPGWTITVGVLLAASFFILGAGAYVAMPAELEAEAQRECIHIEPGPTEVTRLKWPPGLRCTYSGRHGDVVYTETMSFDDGIYSAVWCGISATVLVLVLARIGRRLRKSRDLRAQHPGSVSRHRRYVTYGGRP